MYKTILVPLDGSGVGEAALGTAAAIARRTGARLALIRAARVRKPLGDAAIDQQRAIMQAEVYLTTVADKLSEQGVEVEIGIPYGDLAAAWIIEEIALRKADLVVMATHGRTGPDRWLHGSVAEAVVNRAQVPVVVIRADAPPTPAPFEVAQPTLVVPLDGSELAEAATLPARELAIALTARIVLVGVIPRPGELVAAPGTIVTYVGDDHARLMNDTREYLADVSQRLAGPQTPIETSIRLGDAAAEIAASAAETSAAAIVMATHGRTGLARAFLGSVAGLVLQHSAVPVMLVRPHALRAAEEPAVAARVTAPLPA